MKTRRFILLFPYFCVLIAVLYVMRAGTLKCGDQRWLDGEFLYVAAKVWLDGGVPYDYSLFSSMWSQLLERDIFGAYVHPPTTILFLPLAFFSTNTAQVVFVALNTLALVAFWVIAYYLAARGILKERCTEVLYFIALSVFLSPIPGTLYIGQTGIFTMCGIFGTYYFIIKGNMFIPIPFMLLASFKPQYSCLLFSYLFFRGHYRAILLGVGAIMLTSFVAFGNYQVTDVIEAFQFSLQKHLVLCQA